MSSRHHPGLFHETWISLLSKKIQSSSHSLMFLVPGRVNTSLSLSGPETSACRAAAWGPEAPVEPQQPPPPDTRRPAPPPPNLLLTGAARCPSGPPTLHTNHRAARRQPTALPAPITSHTPCPILRRWPTPRARLLTEVRRRYRLEFHDIKIFSERYCDIWFCRPLQTFIFQYEDIYCLNYHSDALRCCRLSHSVIQNFSKVSETPEQQKPANTQLPVLPRR